jgi:hypothetical protein
MAALIRRLILNLLHSSSCSRNNLIVNPHAHGHWRRGDRNKITHVHYTLKLHKWLLHMSLMIRIISFIEN